MAIQNRFNKIFKRLFWVLLSSGVLLNSPLAISQPSKTLHLGFYQYQSPETIESKYAQFFQYLDEQLPNYALKVHILDSERLLQAARNNQLDLLFVNPNLYEQVRHQVHLEGITATVQRRFHGHRLESLGGVVFTRTNVQQINDLTDLEQKTVAIPTRENTGAYRVPLYELVKQGVDPKSIDFVELGHNDAVVEAVLSGEYPAGMIRTGILEHWEREKGLDLSTVKVLNLQNNAFPQLLSTTLYPEWPFVMMPSLDENLKREITVALFSLRADHPVALQTRITGFVTPKDYSSFESLLRELRLPPYDQVPSLTWLEMLKQNQFTFMSFLLLLSTLLVLLVFSERLRMKFKQQTAELEKQAKVDQLLLALPYKVEQLSEKAFMEFISEHIEQLTESHASFLNFVDEPKGVIYMTGFSKGAHKRNASLKNDQKQHPIDKAGVWAAAIRNKKPVIINDYANYPLKKGLPPGHMPMERLINLVVTEQGQSVMLAGVTGKPTAYTQDDVDLVQILCNQAWQLIKDQRTQAEMQLKSSRISNLINDLGEHYVAFSHTGLEGKLTFISQGFESVFGISAEAVEQKTWFETIQWQADSIVQAEQAVREILQQQATENTFMMVFTHPDGDLRTIKVDQHGVFDEHDQLVSIDGLIIDVTEEIAHQKTLTQAALVFDNTIQGIVISDQNNCILQVNQRFEEITGYCAQEVIGKNPRCLSSGRQDSAFYQQMWQELLANDRWQGELWNRRKNGEFYIESLNISVIRNEAGEVEQFIALMADITLEKNQQKMLEKRAYFDDLTGLPNRSLLSDRISQGIAATQRHDDYLAILFIDLDGFKEINDVFGHPAGDYLLQTIAQRFLHEVRKEDTVARLGGDEFVVTLNRNANNHDFKKIERRILKAAAEPVVYHGQQLRVSSSIGSVHYHPSQHGEKGSESLLRLADQAMYSAKKNGKNQIFNHVWQSQNQKNRLIQALESDEFELYFQPKVNLITGDKNSFEGLIRWHDPQKGVLSPAEFLPQVNEAGLEIELGDLVLRQGAVFVTAMASQGFRVNVSLNITGSYLQHYQFVEKLQNLLQDYPEVSANQITLELLESSALEDLESITEQILAARRIGVKFAIDDFGTGHATLTYLKNLPVNELKIDQEFTFGLFEEANNLSIIEASKSMADAFDLSVVVEGAETEAHIILLMKAGFSTIQGYGIAKPMPIEAVLKWIKTWRPSKKMQQTQPLRGHQKELLKAELMLVSHFNKVVEFAQRSDNQVPMPLELSSQSCQFGRWMQSHALGLMNKPNRQRMDQLHRELHQRYQQILEAKAQQTTLDMEAALQELEQLKLALLDKLYAAVDSQQPEEDIELLPIS